MIGGRRARLGAVGAAIALASAACTASAPIEGARDAEGALPALTAEPEQVADAVPSGQPLVDGLARVEVLGPGESGAGEAPLFSWAPVEGAATYHLVVLGPEGPIWAWSGADTRVRLGALPFERPPGVGGPAIVAGSCWSVTALDADGHVVAASDFLPVSPAESDGHVCVAGSGAAPAS